VDAVRVRVDRDLCIGVGNCVAYAPTVFELDEENKAVILDPSSLDNNTLLEAAKSCPENAIIVEDDERRQLCP
jgi:ferredoxin